MKTDTKLTLEDIAYVKLINIGSVNPQKPLSEESKQKQVDLLNRCLTEIPKGRIIAMDRSVGRFMIGQHEMDLEKVTYHVGFERKPFWLDEK